MSVAFDLGQPAERPAGSPVEVADLETALRGITEAARQVITGVDHASITVVGPKGEVETFAPTDDLVARSDELQYQHREGPCLQAVSTGEDVIAGDIASDPRWSQYGPLAAKLGIVAQVSLPLHSDNRTWGALNLYSLTEGAFDDVSLETAERLASSAAGLLGLTRKVSTLSEALATRTTIGAAIGIVMEHHGIDQDHAFAFLVRSSQAANVKLRQVARQIVDEADRKARVRG
jgi:GAF domain-containing protein